MLLFYFSCYTVFGVTTEIIGDRIVTFVMIRSNLSEKLQFDHCLSKTKYDVTLHDVIIHDATLNDVIVATKRCFQSVTIIILRIIPLMFKLLCLHVLTGWKFLIGTWLQATLGKVLFQGQSRG